MDVAIDETHGEQAPSKTGLHIGCGTHMLQNWVNADFYPQSDDVVFLDATKPFAYDNETFDFVFSEHMIEHIDYESGLLMLSECFRVLRPGGVVRITTPDLRSIIDVYQNARREDHAAYIKWAQHHFFNRMPSHSPGFFFNNFMRAWGHQFIYDPDTLTLALVRSGFTQIIEHRLNESEHGPLRNLETIGRMPPGFLQIESMSLEGTKA